MTAVAAQKTLFDFPVSPARAAMPSAPHARDSETSESAAHSIEPSLSRLQVAVLDFIRGKGHRGATDEEISIGLDLLSDTARARRVELRNLGDVFDSGRVRFTRHGREATVWIVAAFAGWPETSASTRAISREMPGHQTPAAVGVARGSDTATRPAASVPSPALPNKPAEEFPRGWARAALAEGLARARGETLPIGGVAAIDQARSEAPNLDGNVPADPPEARADRAEPAGPSAPAAAVADRGADFIEVDGRRLPRPCRRHTRFWLSLHGQPICGTCHPAPIGIQRRWIDAPIVATPAAVAEHSGAN